MKKTIFGISILLATAYSLHALPALAQGVALPNPLGIDSVPSLIGRVIQGLTGIVGSIALAMFLYGGFLWLTSAGNNEKIKKGKEILIWAVLGLALIFSSYIIVNFVITGITTGAGTAVAPAKGVAQTK